MDRTLFAAGGRPVTAVTAAEMREVDRVAVEEFGVDLLQMMENAGRTLALQAEEATDGPVVVAAGNGGNGGGGLACARHLLNRGVDVRVALDRPPGELTGAAAHQYDTLAEMDAPVGVGPGAVDPAAGLVVDALIGYGLDGPVRGTAAGMVGAVDGGDTPVLSLDVPSGRDATDGGVRGVAVEPDATLTLALPKTGLPRENVVLADIGVPAGVYGRVGLPYDPLPGYRVGLDPR